MRWLFLAALSLGACSGVESRTAVDEPLRVTGASFKSGALPGSAAARPEVTSLETPSTIVRVGQTDKSIVGRTSTDAVAIALAFADIGTGYWVLPVGGPDPSNGGELEWAGSLSIGDVPAGPRELRVVAIDAAGHAGPQRTIPLCVAPATPDNLAACDPTAKLPAVVVSLTWDAPVDLDLVVSAPDGSLVSAKRPRIGDVDAGGAGTIDRDSNAACVLDRIQREDLVFQTAPPAGSYLVYANLFDACGHGPVHFRVTVKHGADVTITRDGTLLALGANGGAALGTFVTELAFQ